MRIGILFSVPPFIEIPNPLLSDFIIWTVLFWLAMGSGTLLTGSPSGPQKALGSSKSVNVI